MRSFTFSTANSASLCAETPFFSLLMGFGFVAYTLIDHISCLRKCLNERERLGSMGFGLRLMFIITLDLFFSTYSRTL